MACKCVWCTECDGSGDVWVSPFGHYRGRHKADDLDHLEICGCCDGEGISEVCDECREEYQNQIEEAR